MRWGLLIFFDISDSINSSMRLVMFSASALYIPGFRPAWRSVLARANFRRPYIANSCTNGLNALSRRIRKFRDQMETVSTCQSATALCGPSESNLRCRRAYSFSYGEVATRPEQRPCLVDIATMPPWKCALELPDTDSVGQQFEAPGLGPVCGGIFRLGLLCFRPPMRLY